jgi:hypothetical protein
LTTDATDATAAAPDDPAVTVDRPATTASTSARRIAHDAQILSTDPLEFGPIQNRCNTLKVVQLDVLRPELLKSPPFGEPKFLVGYENEPVGVVSCLSSPKVSGELGTHVCEGLLTSRKVDSAHEPSTCSLAGDVLAAVRSTEGVARVDVFESLSMQ